MLERLTRWALAALLLSALSACANVAYKRAIVDVPDVERAIAIAKELDSRKDQKVPDGAPWFEIKRGTRPAIVTAPHATQPFREGKVRFADGGGTGGLAAGLNAMCDVTAIYTTYDSPSDPNFYDDNAFKASLAELIASVKPVVLLDIHASHPFRPYDVDIGTMSGNSLMGDRRLLPDLIKGFRREGILGISIDWFAASKQQTITKFASARGVPSVQLELSSTRTTPFGNALAEHRFAQTLEALAAFLGERGLCVRVR